MTAENSIAFGVKREPGEMLKTLPISILIIFSPPYRGRGPGDGKRSWPVNW